MADGDECTRGRLTLANNEELGPGSPLDVILEPTSGNILIIAWEFKTEAEAIQAGRNPVGVIAVWPDLIMELEPTPRRYRLDPLPEPPWCMRKFGTSLAASVSVVMA